MKRKISICRGDLSDIEVKALQEKLSSAIPVLSIEEIEKDWDGVLFFGGDKVGDCLSSKLSSVVPLVSFGRSDCYPSVLPSFQEALETLQGKYSSLAIPSSHLYMEAREWCLDRGIENTAEGIPLESLLELPYQELVEKGKELFEKCFKDDFVEDCYVPVPLKRYPKTEPKYILSPLDYVDKLSKVGFSAEIERKEKSPSLLVMEELKEVEKEKDTLVLLLSDEVPLEAIENRSVLVAPICLLEEEGFLLKLKEYIEKGKLPSSISSLLSKRAIEKILSLPIGERIKKEELASTLGVSPDYLERAFRKTYGIKLWDFLQAWKVEQALRLIQEGRSIREGAEKAGFSSQSYFSRVFLKHRKLNVKAYLSKGKVK